jgi:hypothetical protein
LHPSESSGVAVTRDVARSGEKEKAL